MANRTEVEHNAGDGLRCQADQFRASMPPARRRTTFLYGEAVRVLGAGAP